MTTIDNCPAMTYHPQGPCDRFGERTNVDDLSTQTDPRHRRDVDDNAEFDVLLTIYQEMYQSITREMVAMENLLGNVSAACQNIPLRMPVFARVATSNNSKLNNTSVQTCAAVGVHQTTQTLYKCDVIENEAGQTRRDISGAVTSNHMITAMAEEDCLVRTSVRDPLKDNGSIETPAEVAYRNNPARCSDVIVSPVTSPEVNFTKEIDDRYNCHASFGDSLCATTTGSRELTNWFDGTHHGGELLSVSAKTTTLEIKPDRGSGSNTTLLSHQLPLPLTSSSTDTTINWVNDHFDVFMNGIADFTPGLTKDTAGCVTLGYIGDTSSPNLHTIPSSPPETVQHAQISGRILYGSSLGDDGAQPEVTRDDAVTYEVPFDARCMENMTSSGSESGTNAVIADVQGSLPEPTASVVLPGNSVAATWHTGEERKNNTDLGSCSRTMVDHASAVLCDVIAITLPSDSEFSLNAKDDNVSLKSVADGVMSRDINNSAAAPSRDAVISNGSEADFAADMMSRVPSIIGPDFRLRTDAGLCLTSTQRASVDELAQRQKNAADKHQVTATTSSSNLPVTKSMSLPLTSCSKANHVTSTVHVLRRCNSTSCSRATTERPRKRFRTGTVCPGPQPDETTQADTQPSPTEPHSDETARPLAQVLIPGATVCVPTHTQSAEPVGGAPSTPPSTDHATTGDDFKTPNGGCVPDVSQKNAIQRRSPRTLQNSGGTKSCGELLASTCSHEYATCCCTASSPAAFRGEQTLTPLLNGEKQPLDTTTSPPSTPRANTGNSQHRGNDGGGASIGDTPDTRARGSTGGRGRPSAIPVGKYRTSPAAGKRVTNHPNTMKTNQSEVDNAPAEVRLSPRPVAQRQTSSSLQRPTATQQPPPPRLSPRLESTPTRQPQQPTRQQQQPLQEHKHNDAQQQDVSQQQRAEEQQQQQQQLLQRDGNEQQQQLHERQLSLQVQKEQHLQLQQQNLLLQKKQKVQRQQQQQQQQRHKTNVQQQRVHKTHTRQQKRQPQKQDFSPSLHQQLLQQQQHLHHRQLSQQQQLLQDNKQQYPLRLREHGEDEYLERFEQERWREDEEDESDLLPPHLCTPLSVQPQWPQCHVMPRLCAITETALDEQDATTMKYLVTQLVCNLQTVATLEDKITTLEHEPYSPPGCQISPGYSPVGMTRSFSQGSVMPSFSPGGVMPSFSPGGVMPSFSPGGVTPSFSPPYYARRQPVGVSAPTQAGYGCYSAQLQFAPPTPPCWVNHAPTLCTNFSPRRPPCNLYGDTATLDYYSL